MSVRWSHPLVLLTGVVATLIVAGPRWPGDEAAGAAVLARAGRTGVVA